MKKIVYTKTNGGNMKRFAFVFMLVLVSVSVFADANIIGILNSSILYNDGNNSYERGHNNSGDIEIVEDIVVLGISGDQVDVEKSKSDESTPNWSEDISVAPDVGPSLIAKVALILSVVNTVLILFVFKRIKVKG